MTSSGIDARLDLSQPLERGLAPQRLAWLRCLAKLQVHVARGPRRQRALDRLRPASRRQPALGSGGHPDRVHRVRRVDRGQRAVLRARAAELAAQLPQLDRQQREPAPGAGGLRRTSSTASLRQRRRASGRRRSRAPDARDPCADGWLGAPASRSLDRVVDRAQRAQRRQQPIGLGRSPRWIASTSDERLAADRLGDLRDRRQVQQPTDRRQLVRELALGELAPGMQDLGRRARADTTGCPA